VPNLNFSLSQAELRALGLQEMYALYNYVAVTMQSPLHRYVCQSTMIALCVYSKVFLLLSAASN